MNRTNFFLVVAVIASPAMGGSSLVLQSQLSSHALGAVPQPRQAFENASRKDFTTFEEKILSDHKKYVETDKKKAKAEIEASSQKLLYDEGVESTLTMNCVEWNHTEITYRKFYNVKFTRTTNPLPSSVNYTFFELNEKVLPGFLPVDRRSLQKFKEDFSIHSELWSTAAWDGKKTRIHQFDLIPIGPNDWAYHAVVRNATNSDVDSLTEGTLVSHVEIYCR